MEAKTERVDASIGHGGPIVSSPGLTAEEFLRGTGGALLHPVAASLCRSESPIGSQSEWRASASEDAPQTTWARILWSRWLDP